MRVSWRACSPPNLPAGDDRLHCVIERGDESFPLEKIVIFGTINAADRED
jgi:hypothetical protein